MKIIVIVGTRPEIIKMSPIIRELDKRGGDYFILHTGQHYSYNLDKIFFNELKLPHPKYNLEIGSGSHAEQTAKILTGVEDVLLKESPDIILVEGDTNSVLGSALAASKLHIKIGHVEAGLRSYNRQMPEEINRILTDHCSDYLFTPTQKSKIILQNEGIAEEKILVTGNTIVDAVYQNIELADKLDNCLDEIGIKPQQYFLVTLHRQENVDNIARFTSILSGLNRIVTEFDLPVIYPIHPRSRKMMAEYGLESQNLKLIDPYGFLYFLQLEKNARLILTDSGGVQEESCTLGVPCVTVRDDTERPETVEAGANILAGTSPDAILNCTHTMLNKENKWINPLGDGTAGRRIVDACEN